MAAAALAGYWALIIGLSIVVGYLGRAVARHLMQNATIPLRELFVGAFLTIVFSPMVWAINSWVSGVPDAGLPFLQLAASIMVVTLGLSVLRFALGLELIGQASSEEEAVMGEAIPRFAERLPDWSGSPIIHLTVDDHYTEAHCLDGSSYRVLIRFADAVNEMEGLRGTCIHRSHWVVLDYIAGTQREKGRDFVRLATGTVLPVSRKYRPNLVEAGVLAPTGRRVAA